ncbi:MAG: hemagglutinin protein [Acidobacteriaceae bacterium]|nr:hemagglutinin protein [Acidobacteriaceae bacterium]
MKRAAKKTTTIKVAGEKNAKVLRLNDPIRIVPLHLPSELYRPSVGIAAAPAAQLTYRQGPLLVSVKVLTIFWGQAWQTSPNSDLANQINQFFSFVVSSALMDQLAEYSVPGQPIGRGSFIGTVNISQPALSHSVTDAAIQTMLQQEINNNSSVPKPDANTLYFVYLPPGTAVVQGGSRSCQAFCGYHDTFGSGIYYAVMPFPNCAGCLGGMTNLDALTSTSSHEFCEAITDPVPGQGWYDDAHGEIGDICAWQTKKLGNYTVQLEWSNQGASCK